MKKWWSTRGGGGSAYSDQAPYFTYPHTHNPLASSLLFPSPSSPSMGGPSASFPPARWQGGSSWLTGRSSGGTCSAYWNLLIINYSQTHLSRPLGPTTTWQVEAGPVPQWLTQTSTRTHSHCTRTRLHWSLSIMLSSSSKRTISMSWLILTSDLILVKA